MTDIGYWYPLDESGNRIDSETRRQVGRTYYRHAEVDGEIESFIHLTEPDDGFTYSVYEIPRDYGEAALTARCLASQALDRNNRQWGWSIGEATETEIEEVYAFYKNIEDFNSHEGAV